MAGMDSRSFDKADETRTFENGRIDIVHLAKGTVGRAVFEPGWRWSESVKPIVGTDSCEIAHLGYIVAGRLHVRMNDGSEIDVGPGDAFEIEPGHDAWVVGDDDCVALDFIGAEKYATS